jgi:Tfp pilus assembly protein PilF
MGDISLGRYEYAVGDVTYVLDTFVNHPTALQILGVVAQLKKNPLLPIPFYKRALSLYPRYAVTHAQYGQYLVSIDHIREGIEKLKEAIELDAKLVVAHVWLARAYARIGEVALAQQASQDARGLGFTGRIVGGTEGEELRFGK